MQLKSLARRWPISQSVSIRIGDLHVIWHRPASPAQTAARGNLLFTAAAGIGCRTYQSFLSKISESCNLNVFTYDTRGIGDSHLPVAPAYANGKKDIGRMLGTDLKNLFWALRDYASKEMPADAGKQWIFCGHSLGTWLSVHAAVFTHIRKLILLDPPLFPLQDAARWALACQLGRRNSHPLSRMTRRRKRTFRNSEQAIWVFSKLEFFKGWSKEHLAAYVDANYKADDMGLTLRHNPFWEADIIESQPASAAIELLSLPKEARNDMNVHAVFGLNSPFYSIESALLLRTAFRNSQIHSVQDASHMLVFQNEEALLKLFKENIVNDDFLEPPALAHQEKIAQGF